MLGTISKIQWFYKNVSGSLTDVAQLVGASSHKLKGREFDSPSGHVPKLWVQSPVGAHMGDNKFMFLSDIDVSLPPSLPLPLSLKAMKKMSLSEDKN